MTKTHSNPVLLRPDDGRHRSTDRFRVDQHDALAHRWIPCLIGVFLGFSVFNPHLLGKAIAPALVLALLAAIYLESVIRGTMAPWVAVTSLLLPSLVGGILILFPADNNATQNWTLRWLLIFPIALTAGVVVNDSVRRKCYYSGYAIVACCVVPFAIYEWITASPVFDRLISGQEFSYYVEGGTARAAVGASHPLILGVLFASAIPWAMNMRPVFRLTWIGWFLIATACTGSEGPLLVAVFFAVVTGSNAVQSVIGKRTVVLYCSLSAALAILAYHSAFLWDRYVPGNDSVSYSRGYREALYSIVVDMLNQHPFGYGPTGVPVGEWFLVSTYKGIRDIQVTVDSEFVLIAFEFGVLGCAFFVATLVLGIKTLRMDVQVGAVVLILSLLGFVVATHAFIELGVVWMIAIGAAFSAISQRRVPVRWPSEISEYRGVSR